MTTHQMLAQLQELFGEQSRAAKYQVCQKLFKAKMHDGQSVYDHYLTIIKDIKELKRLDMTMHKELLIDLIL